MGMRKLFAIISVSMFALLFVCLFLPYVDNGYGGTISLWDGYGDTLKTVLVIEILAGLVICGLTIGDVTLVDKCAEVWYHIIIGEIKKTDVISNNI